MRMARRYRRSAAAASPALDVEHGQVRLAFGPIGHELLRRAVLVQGGRRAGRARPPAGLGWNRRERARGVDPHGAHRVGEQRKHAARAACRGLDAAQRADGRHAHERIGIVQRALDARSRGGGKVGLAGAHRRRPRRWRAGPGRRRPRPEPRRPREGSRARRGSPRPSAAGWLARSPTIAPPRRRPTAASPSCGSRCRRSACRSSPTGRDAARGSVIVARVDHHVGALGHVAGDAARAGRALGMMVVRRRRELRGQVAARADARSGRR